MKRETNCKNFGIASRGKKNPDKKRAGSIVIMTVIIASCWVFATVEASNPIARLESRKRLDKKPPGIQSGPVQ